MQMSIDLCANALRNYIGHVGRGFDSRSADHPADSSVAEQRAFRYPFVALSSIDIFVTQKSKFVANACGYTSVAGSTPALAPPQVARW